MKKTIASDISLYFSDITSYNLTIIFNFVFTEAALLNSILNVLAKIQSYRAEIYIAKFTLRGPNFKA